jgi:DNA-binding XRE family transcriptional regulator
MHLEGQTSPIGNSSGEARRRRTTRSAKYRYEAARLGPYEALARMVIARRIRYGLTQGQLAARMGTSVPAISRLESGQHLPSLATLARVASAFGERLVVGFDDEAGKREVTFFTR